jgi:hypothetical protein
MDAESYLHWIRNTDLEMATHSDLKEAVEEIVEALQDELSDSEDRSGEDMLEALEEILEALAGGQLPLSQIQDFRDDFFSPVDFGEAPEVVLEQELREIAAGIARERWVTESYLQLQNAVEAYLDGGDEDQLWQVVNELEKILEESQTDYESSRVLPREITTESAVAHRLLIEGMELWREALTLLQDGDPEVEPDWEGILHTSELGNRLLVAVQIFNSRLQSALSGNS